MITIISGTNRENSNSQKVSESCLKILKEQGYTAQICSLTALPDDFFSVIYDKASPGYQHLIDDFIKDADQLVFVLPEYQGSYPGVLKAFLDAIDPKLMAEKKACLIGVASGRAGGIRPLSHFTDVLHHLNVEVFSSQPKLSGIDGLVDDGKISDLKTIEGLKVHFTKFLNF
jgi:chromate reductase